MSPEGGAESKKKPATARVFFALWPSHAVAVALADIASEAAGRYGGRATRVETIHLTLAFIGEVPEASLPLLCDMAGTLNVPPFALSIDRLGFWSHNRLLWAGCSKTPAALTALVGELQQTLVAAGFVVDRAERRFSPHVTLVRKIPLTVAPSADDPLAKIAPLNWPCSRWVLVRSRLTEAGSSYQAIAEFPLNG